MAAWGVMVTLCGLTASFVQLLLIRIGVAVGEAGCLPAVNSLIPDHFTRAERPRAVAICMMGGSLSFVIGYFVAGWLNELWGWRAMFMMLGLPGLGLAALAWFTLREPRLGKPSIEADGHASISMSVGKVTATPPSPRERRGDGGEVPPSLKEVCVTLWASRAFRHLLFYFSVGSFFNVGILQWQPAFLIRSYGLKTGELGTWLAVVNAFSGVLGTYIGGELASRRAANNEPLQLMAIAVLYSSLGVITAFIYLVHSHYLAFGLIALATVVLAAISGPLYATIQTLVPPQMRATSIALILLFSSLIGTGLGPLTVGVLSDGMRPLAGENSLRYALLALCPGYLWAAWHLWRASKTVIRDLKEVEGDYGRVAVRSDSQ
jgi:MFS family permease